MKNYTILYKCDRCGNVSSELKLYCWFCGNKLLYKEELKNVRGIK